MLRDANTFVPEVHISEHRNKLFPLHAKPFESQCTAKLRILIFAPSAFMANNTTNNLPH